MQDLSAHSGAVEGGTREIAVTAAALPKGVSADVALRAIVQEMIQNLHSPKGPVRSLVVRVLAACGPTLVPTVVNSLWTPDDRTRSFSALNNLTCDSKSLRAQLLGEVMRATLEFHDLLEYLTLVGPGASSVLPKIEAEMKRLKDAWQQRDNHPNQYLLRGRYAMWVRPFVFAGGAASAEVLPILRESREWAAGVVQSGFDTAAFLEYHDRLIAEVESGVVRAVYQELDCGYR